MRKVLITNSKKKLVKYVKSHQVESAIIVCGTAVALAFLVLLKLALFPAEGPQKFAREVKEGITYEEAKMKYPDIVQAPNVSDKEYKDELTKKVNSRPTNAIIEVFDNYQPQVQSIRPGDLVTWKNRSGEAFSVVGQDDWGSFEPVMPGNGFSQQFDLAGEYKYKLVSIDGVKMRSDVIRVRDIE